MPSPPNTGSLGESLRAANASKTPGPCARSDVRDGVMVRTAPATRRSRRVCVGDLFIFQPQRFSWVANATRQLDAAIPLANGLEDGWLLAQYQQLGTGSHL